MLTLNYQRYLSQCLYVVYDCFSARKQVFAKFLKELLACTWLHM